MFDPEKQPPERIYGWRDSQLSIARHYGGIRYNNYHYLIAFMEEGQPLVREDVLRREAKEQKEKQKQERKEAEAKQQTMI